MNDENSDEIVRLNPPVKLFFQTTVKLFVSEKIGQKIGGDGKPWEFSEVSTYDGFKEMLFERVKPYLKRGINFVEKEEEERVVPEWDGSTDPDFEDLHKFVSIFDEGFRKTFDLTNLSHTDLQRWDKKTNRLYIFPYSSNIRRQKDYVAAKSIIQQAETDRAGAASINELNNIVAQLKEKHRYHYRAAEITWMQ